nr:hypothetical protein [Desulfobacula sp.]
MTGKKYSKPVRGLALFSGLILFSCLVPAGAARAGEQMVEKDLDNNGVMDQRAFYDENKKLVRLEVDSDQDGRFEVIQYYTGDKISRVERDTDLDGKIDCIDHYQGDLRERQERLDKNNRLVQATRFSKDGLPVSMERDSSGKGKFDTFIPFPRASSQAWKRTPRVTEP